MPIIEEPLTIGARDLLRGVDVTYYGDIYVLNKTLIGKKWKQRYVVFSQGCLYIYSNRSAKRPEQSYSFKLFESATESEPENGESVCFCLSYKTAQAPILFSCDTAENRSKWIQKFRAAISEVKGQYCSVDSGFGSAEATAYLSTQRPHGETDDSYLRYDVVNEKGFGIVKDVDKSNGTTSLPVQPCDDDSAYEDPISIPVSNVPLYMNKDGGHEYADYRSAAKKENTEKEKQGATVRELMNDLKVHFTSDKSPLHPSTNLKMKPLTPPKPKAYHAPLSTQALTSTSKASTSNILVLQGATASRLSDKEQSSTKYATSSFGSVRQGPSVSVSSRYSMPSCDNTLSRSSFQEGIRKPIEESSDDLTTYCHENLYENNESDSSTDSDTTSPKVIYENTETALLLTKKFVRAEYFCDDKGVGKRSLKRQEVGSFAVFSASDSAEQELCVKTSERLIYFRIYSQNDRVSLFKLHQRDTFTSIDCLLSFYSMNELPSQNYKIKLNHGYKSS